jgi:hypothetical protein
MGRFKTDYLNCYNRSNIYNFTSETITEEQTEWLDELYKGESQITQNGETYRTTSAVFIYTDETTSDTDKQFAETFTPSSGEVKIWVNKKNGKLEFKSAIPDFAAEATGLTKTQVKEQIINKIFDDYTASLQGWDQVASVLYEFFDLTRKKVRYFRVPERFWNCNDNEIYKPWLHVTIRHFIAPVRDNGSKYKSMAGAALEYEFKQAFPGLKDAIEGLDEPEAEFAFYCGIWNGVVEVVATVPDFLAFVTGALSADVVDDFRQTLIALNRYEGEDGKTGMWAAMENGLYQSVNGNCKLAELSGEIVFIVALAAVNPAALNRVQALAGPALANIIRVLKAFDAVADALPGYAIKFATNGAASFFDGGRLVARAVDGSFTGKALRISDNAIVDLPPHNLTDNLPTANNGKIEIEISGLKYRLIDQALSERYLALSSELRNLIDNFGFGSLKLADSGSDIIFLAVNGTDEIARIVGDKLIPKRFISSGTDIGNSVDNLQMVKNGDNIGFRIANSTVSKLGINFTDFKATVKGGFPNPNLADEAFYLYGEQNWGELYNLFQREHLNPVTDAKGITTYWPPANGGYNIRKGQPIIGKYDRYQKTLITDEQSLTDPFNPTFTGTYTSPLDNSGKLPYEKRALEGPENSYDLYYEIEILEELTFTGDLADVIPWHGFKLLPTPPSML